MGSSGGLGKVGRGGTRDKRDRWEDGVKLPTLLAAILTGAPWIEAFQTNLGWAWLRSGHWIPVLLLCVSQSVSSIWFSYPFLPNARRQMKAQRGKFLSGYSLEDCIGLQGRESSYPVDWTLMGFLFLMWQQVRVVSMGWREVWACHRGYGLRLSACGRRGHGAWCSVSCSGLEENLWQICK